MGGLKVTSAKARRKCLFDILMRWNIQLPKDYCCEYHRLVKAGLAQLKALTKRQCLHRDQFLPDTNAQCYRCGLMLSEVGDVDSGFNFDVCEYCPDVSRVW